MIQEKRSKAQIAQLEIYTDGALKKIGAHATFGGWSFIALRGGERIYEVAGCEYGTTNQRMELLAIRNALEFAQKNRHPNENVIIYSDSAYAINCYIQEWYTNWQRNGWVRQKNQPIENLDLVKQIWEYCKLEWPNFTVEKIPGHSGLLGNELADALANNDKTRINNLQKEIEGDVYNGINL